MSSIVKTKKVRLSYFVPVAVIIDIREKMISEGYDLKSKSKWIAEAVNSLLLQDNYRELVNINDQMQNFEKLDSVSIDKDLKLKIDNAVVEVRRHYPAIEGVQSKIFRTAIVQRLIK